jgi:hypothetical protein
LHQVGVSFDLYYDARKHKIKKKCKEISLHLVQLLDFCNVLEYLYLFIVSLATILVFWMKITNWKDCIRDRIKWKTLFEKAKTSLKLWRLRKKEELVFWTNSVEEHRSGYMDTESQPRTFRTRSNRKFIFSW